MLHLIGKKDETSFLMKQSSTVIDTNHLRHRSTSSPVASNGEPPEPPPTNSILKFTPIVLLKTNSQQIIEQRLNSGSGGENKTSPNSSKQRLQLQQLHPRSISLTPDASSSPSVDCQTSNRIDVAATSLQVPEASTDRHGQLTDSYGVAHLSPPEYNYSLDVYGKQVETSVSTGNNNTTARSSSSTTSHWYQGFFNRTSRVIPAKVIFRSTSHSDLKKSEGSNRSPSREISNISTSHSANVASAFAATENTDGNGSTNNVTLPRQEYGSSASIDLLLAQQIDRRTATSNTATIASAASTAAANSNNERRNPKRELGCSLFSASAANRRSDTLESVANKAASSATSLSRHSTSSRDSLGSKKFCSSPSSSFVGGAGLSEPSRASLRRAKAVDLPSYSSGDHHHSNAYAHHAGSSLSPGNNKLDTRSHKKDNKAKTLRSKSSNESILKKLIGGGSKSQSTDDSPTATAASSSQTSNMMTAPSQNSRDSIKPDFSSDSLDFKYEEKLRRRIFAHYDCGSISATPTPLLNGTSRLEEGNLNAATGASQASRPKPTSPSGASEAPWLINDDSRSADGGDSKSNDIVLSCPFFRNELGGEPIRTLSLNRNTPERPADKSTDEGFETWLRPSTAAESAVLENLSNVYLGGRLCAGRQDNLIIEYVDQGAFYYRHCFSGKAHQNYFGTDENLGPVAISVVRDKVENADYKKIGLSSPYIYRIIVRLSDMSTFRGAIMEDSLPSYQSAREQQSMQQTSTPPGSSVNTGKVPVKELIELTIPELQLSCLRLAVPVPRTEELLLKLDEQTVEISEQFSIQSTVRVFFEGLHKVQEVAGPAFEEFLDMLGQRVRLKGFDKYKGGLDNKGDTTGQYSLYTNYQQYEIMFHVSTMLPFTSNNRQQLSRKRHIGNDIVTVIFQDPGALPFSAQTVRSHFQHVFIVVRAHQPNTDNVRYSVAVSRCKDVPSFGPPIPVGAEFAKSKDFRDFLLTKIINAENAVHKSDKFATMAARTRKEFMRDLAENHVTSHSLEGATGKIGKILGTKRRDRPKPKLLLDNFVRGAITWEVQVLVMVEDFSLCKSLDCFLGISADYVVLVEQSKNQDVLFCTPTHSVIGWTSHGNSLKLYYDHAEVIILRSVDDDDAADMQEILRRLQAVTKGCDTVEMILRRNPNGQLGFHIQQEGIVSDVEMYGCAWQAGLRQGSRLVEICKVNVATLTLTRMLDLLRTSANIRVLVIPPLEDGSPRRGCEDPYCPSVMSDECAIAQYLIDQPNQSRRKYPPSYETAMLRKQLITPMTVLTLDPESPSERLKNGFETVGTAFSKSLDELQGRRRHSEELRSNSADYSFRNARKTTAGGYPGTVMSSVSSEEHWYLDNPGVSQRTDTFSSSGSSEASDTPSSKDAPVKPTRPLELKRKVDKTHSDTPRRSSEDAVPRLPSKNYKQKFLPQPQVSLSSGQLTVPPHYAPVKTNPVNSNSLNENLVRLSNDSGETGRNSSDLASSTSPDVNYSGLQLPKSDAKFFLSPETERGIEWSSLVDAATRAIEGMTQKALSNSNSPEMSGYHLKYQAALQRIKLLEEKSERLFEELEKEREIKRDLEVEIVTLRNINKRLEEDCVNAQMELKKFTEWFFRAVENTGSLYQNESASGTGVRNSESNNNRHDSAPPK